MALCVFALGLTGWIRDNAAGVSQEEGKVTAAVALQAGLR
jgi:hypothetical protein